MFLSFSLFVCIFLRLFQADAFEREILKDRHSVLSLVLSGSLCVSLFLSFSLSFCLFFIFLPSSLIFHFSVELYVFESLCAQKIIAVERQSEKRMKRIAKIEKSANEHPTWRTRTAECLVAPLG